MNDARSANVPTPEWRRTAPTYGLLILSHDRRERLLLGGTANPTDEWIARHLTEACGWEWTPSNIVRNRDRVHTLDSGVASA
jgi:hypothetical protein